MPPTFRSYPFPRLAAPLMLGLLMTGCVAPPSYEGAADNVSVADVKRRKVSVDPKGAWQDTGLFLPAGSTAQISAAGKWSPWPAAGLWSGPEGNEAWQGQVAFIPASALMGRLGTNGKPFLVGATSELTAKENGQLYLAMNDLFSALWDNAGEMKAEIKVRYPKPPAASPAAPAN
jgi:glucose dehydrogenase